MVSDCFMCGGREFQSLGAEQLIDRAPIVVSRDVGIHSSPAEVDLVVRSGSQGSLIQTGGSHSPPGDASPQ